MKTSSATIQALLQQAHQRALQLHADSLTLEHLLEATLANEDSAACQAVTFAFADPETLGQEILAIANGLMVVGSKAVLPFSPLAVKSLYQARESAASRGAMAVLLTDVLEHAYEYAPDEICKDLSQAGLSLTSLRHEDESGDCLVDTGPLFRHFHNDTRRCLSLACKVAAQEKLEAISPAHLILGALSAADTRELAGLRLSAAQQILRGRSADLTPPEARQLQPEDNLQALLQSLGDDADSLDLLLACHQHGSPELQAALTRHKISPELLQRARGAWQDESPQTDG